MFEGHIQVDWSLSSCFLYELSMETTPQVSTNLTLDKSSVIKNILIDLSYCVQLVDFDSCCTEIYFCVSSNFCKGNIFDNTTSLLKDSTLQNFICKISSNISSFIISKYIQELCTVQSARLVVAGVMMAAVVHMIPRMADRQYFISSLGNNRVSRTMMTDQSSQIQARTANISALWAWPLYTSTLALIGTSLFSSGKFWQWNCNIANRFYITLQVSRDIRAFGTLYIFGKLYITLFKQHLTCIYSIQGYTQLSPHRCSEVWCHI